MGGFFGKSPAEKRYEEAKEDMEPRFQAEELEISRVSGGQQIQAKEKDESFYLAWHNSASIEDVERIGKKREDHRLTVFPEGDTFKCKIEDPTDLGKHLLCRSD